MRSRDKVLLACALVVGGCFFGLADRAEARPTYFDALTTYYSIAPGSNLDVQEEHKVI